MEGSKKTPVEYYYSGRKIVEKTELKKTLQSFSDSGSSATKRRLDEINTIISSCQFALQKLNPKKYGRSNRIQYADFSGGFPQ